MQKKFIFRIFPGTWSKMAAKYMSIRKGYWECQSFLHPTPNGAFFVLVTIKLVRKLLEVLFGL